MAGAQISFQPKRTSDSSVNPGPGSYGKTNADGRYELKLVTDDSIGAVAGDHRVTIATDKQDNLTDDAGGPVDATLPKQYRDGSTTFTVPEDGTEAADFEIESQPPG